MRRIIGCILLVGAFLGGYHLGRQKDSPDVIGYARTAAVKVAAVVSDMYHSLSDAPGAPASDGDGQPADTSREARASTEPGRDTRAYVNEYYASRPPRGEAQPPPAQSSPPAVNGDNPDVAQPLSKEQRDWAGKLWQAFRKSDGQD